MGGGGGGGEYVNEDDINDDDDDEYVNNDDALRAGTEVYLMGKRGCKAKLAIPMLRLLQSKARDTCAALLDALLPRHIVPAL